MVSLLLVSRSTRVLIVLSLGDDSCSDRVVVDVVEGGDTMWIVLDVLCEEAIRDVVLANKQDFDVCDVSGKKWIEIDFPEDIERAEKEVLPTVDG